MSTLCGTPAWLLLNTSSNGRPAGTMSVVVSNEEMLFAPISGTAGTATGGALASGGVRLLSHVNATGASVMAKLATITAP